MTFGPEGAVLGDRPAPNVTAPRASNPMPETTKAIEAYRPGLFARMSEGLRYKGGVGQYSWLVHRITGVGILAFLILHVLDTFFVVAYPGLYDHTLSLYGGRFPGIVDEQGQPVYYWPLRWAFRLGELGLIACVVFHAVNGLRVAAFDLWPGAVKHQKTIFQAVMIVFLVIMLITSYFVFVPLAQDPVFWNFATDEHAAANASLTNEDVTPAPMPMVVPAPESVSAP